MVELYRDAGLDIYEQVHYGRGEQRAEVDRILSWYRESGSRVLDVGCSGGLHALEFAALGHRVTGIDREPSALRRARGRSRAWGLAARFCRVDIEQDSLARLGRFDLVYSIGNVLSHIRRDRLGAVVRKIRGCCADNGTFLFDLFVIGPGFREEIRDEELGIVWRRKLDAATGKIALRGAFARYGVTQDFQVWGHAVEEVTALLHRTGFTAIEHAAALDFSPGVTSTTDPCCLRFRARG